MIEIDGSHGEGGGQILRSSLSLSIVTGKPFSIVNIRANRARKGLLRQHLTAVNAARTISDAYVEGAELGSTTLRFEPNGVRGGSYRFAIGSAGSAMLVLETILLPLARAEAPSEVVVEGGTHNSSAPPFPFLERSYLPVLARMGVRTEAVLERAGFLPRGGGRVRVRIEPGELRALNLEDRGAPRSRRAIALIASLPEHIAERELAVLRNEAGISDGSVVALPADQGPGNVVFVELAFEHVTNVLTGFGEKGTRAEEVATKLANEIRRFERANVAVDEHLADQLLLPMALGEGGRFTTTAPTSHSHTHADVIALFLDRRVRFEQIAGDAHRVTVA